MTNPFHDLSRAIIEEVHRVVARHLRPFTTSDGKLNVSSQNTVGRLPLNRGGTGNSFGFKDHSHAGGAANGQKLAQANTHQVPDTDSAPTSIHHTLGVGANQAAAGNDLRLSDARSPTPHVARHATVAGGDFLDPAIYAIPATTSHEQGPLAGHLDVLYQGINGVGSLVGGFGLGGFGGGPFGGNEPAPRVHTHTQSESHGSPDTDLAATSLHHTLGTSAFQAAAGNDARFHDHANKATLDAVTAAFLAADRTKLDGIAAGAQVNVLEGVTGTAPIIAGALAGKSQALSIAAATPTAAGSMSAADKALLDGVLVLVGESAANTDITRAALAAGFQYIPAADAATPLAVTFASVNGARYLAIWLVRVYDAPNAAQQVFIGTSLPLNTILAGGGSIQDYTFNGVYTFTGDGTTVTATLQTYYYNVSDRRVIQSRYLRIFRMR